MRFETTATFLTVFKTRRGNAFKRFHIRSSNLLSALVRVESESDRRSEVRRRLIWSYVGELPLRKCWSRTNPTLRCDARLKTHSACCRLDACFVDEGPVSSYDYDVHLRVGVPDRDASKLPKA